MISGQHLLKIFAVLSLASTAAAIGYWYVNEAPPPAWTFYVSLTFFGLALLAGLIGIETRPRLMLRFLAALSALVAAIALVSDLSQPAGVGAAPTSFIEHIGLLSPSLVASLESKVTNTLGVAAWDPLLKTLVSAPTFIVFGVLTILCGIAGRPRRRISVFVN